MSSMPRRFFQELQPSARHRVLFGHVGQVGEEGQVMQQIGAVPAP
ncbi:hypothetical protein ACH4LS_16785 [Streptomyces luteogriseus]